MWASVPPRRDQGLARRVDPLPTHIVLKIRRIACWFVEVIEVPIGILTAENIEYKELVA